MKRSVLIPVVLALVLLAAEQAKAGLIIVPPGSGSGSLGWQIQSFSRIGQYFLAEDARISSIGFWLDDFNPQLAPWDHSILISLYQDLGYQWTVLATGVAGTPAAGPGWADADFSSVALSVGRTYYVVLSDSTPRWAANAANDNPYPNGFAFVSDVIQPDLDLLFRVIPQSAPVPEPSTVLVWSGLGVVGAVMARRRRKWSA
jgi:hypothetical protein